MSYQDSLVLISSTAAENHNYGTGFVIEHEGRYSYVLTCAHVVRSARGADGKILVNRIAAEEIVMASEEGLDDLAILQVEGLPNAPALRRTQGAQGQPFTTIGFQPLALNTASGRLSAALSEPVHGTLGSSRILQLPGQSFRIKLWHLRIESENTPNTGYSGAPVVVTLEGQEHVVGVVSLKHNGQVMAIAIEVLDKIWYHRTHVPFINRIDEINTIISTEAPAYFLLDAPAGYGKSSMLREIERRFCALNWMCAYITVKEIVDLDKLAEKIVKELFIPDLLPPFVPGNPAGARLASALQSYWEKFEHEGIVLLFDIEDRIQDQNTLRKLLEDFISLIQNGLSELDFFGNNGNKFRAIIAGRYVNALYSSLSVEGISIAPSRQTLSPFDYSVVLNSAKLYLKKRSDPRVAQLAAHLLFYTGGHPGCMASVLHDYKRSGMSSELYFNVKGLLIWNEIVNPVCQSILQELPSNKGVQKIVSNNVLRYLDYPVLRKLINDLEITDVQDEYQLADELTGTYLLTWNTHLHLLLDDITRRLICIGLRNKEDSNSFMQLCENAKQVCIERLKDPFVSNPEIWAIEYWFQSLQQYNPKSNESRSELRHKFINVEIPKVLNILVGMRHKREQQRFLNMAINQDWEFMFTVNYYLYQGGYSGTPLDDLKVQISQFFRDYVGG